MSTRASIIIKDSYSQLFFYRHSDGYPEGTLPTLEKFLSWVKEGKIRNNVSQAAGWLILIGLQEYGNGTDQLGEIEPTDKGFSGWKIGAYEPTNGVNGDEEYQYIIDLDKKTIKVKEL